MAAEPEVDLTGRILGRFRILQPIGQGGMGRVYLAERADGEFQQRAALKLVQHANGGSKFLDSFKQERQIVASLEHPNIAHLLDGGVTEDGRPYLVMELVDGDAIDDYCQRHELTLAQRLALFRKVCAAVHHAHRHLVVHCDLKPSNILVNEEGEPKLLDFGISKLLGSDHGPRQGGEEEGSPQPITPEFASPEQLRGERPTTASDIYSLGVLLHFLLTGSLPYRLSGATRQELEASMGKRDPVRPSAMDRRLAGDVDAIVAKALHPEPAKRYGSVEQFSEDVERHQKYLPISARRPRPAYRAARFLRRHWLATAAAGVTASALLVGLLVSLRLWQLAERRGEAEAKAHAQTEAALSVVGDVFRQLDPSRTRDPDLRVKDLLDALAHRVRHEPAQLPSLHQALGDAYLNLGQTDLAEEFLQEALDLQRELYGDEPYPRIAETLNSLGLLYRDVDDLSKAEDYTLQSLSMRQVLAAEQASRERLLAEAESLDGLALLRRGQGDFAAAQQAFEQALALRRRYPQENRRELSISLNGLGVVLLDQGRPQDALPHLNEALDIRHKLYGDRHLLVATSLNNLGNALEQSGESASAVQRYEEAVTIFRELFPPGHPALAKTLTNLAGIVGDAQLVRAHQLLEEAIDIHQRMGSPTDQAESLVQSGNIHYRQGDYHAAERQLLTALDLQIESLGADHPDVTDTLLNLGWVRLALGELPAMVPRLREVLEAMDGRSTMTSANRAFVEGLLGLSLNTGGERTEGNRHLAEARRRLQAANNLDLLEKLDEIVAYQANPENPLPSE